RLQDLVGPAQLAVLALQLHQALVLGGRHARPLAAVDLSAPDPLAQRLRRRDPQLRGDRGDRRPLRVVLAPVLPHHPDRPLAQLVRVLRRSAHRSILSQNGASTFPGAVQAPPGSWGRDRGSPTLTPQPSTLNPQPSTLNPHVYNLVPMNRRRFLALAVAGLPLRAARAAWAADAT